MHALDEVAGWPVSAAAAGVIRFGPDGFGPTEEFGDADLILPWASSTKPATALAVLVAVEEGSLELDRPAGPPGSTVRHLLAHASGLGPEPGPPIDRPGRRRIYSNAGYRCLAQLVEAASGLTFSDYLAAGVLEPLGMVNTGLTGPPSDAAGAGLAGPLVDLVALAKEWARPTLVGHATWRDATSVQFRDLAGVLPGYGPSDPCDWGLGVEVKGTKRPHWTGPSNSAVSYGHFGQSGSFFWIDPVAGVLCCGLSDRPFGVWASRAWPALAEAVLAESADLDRPGRSPERP